MLIAADMQNEGVFKVCIRYFIFDWVQLKSQKNFDKLKIIVY